MRRLALAAAIAVSCISSAHAVEGMWQPAQLPTIANDLKQHGLQLDPNSLTDLTAHPMGAIVSLGGCTASFVSPEGLIVTNHHCGYGALQYNSTAEKNLIEDGFLAHNFGEELPGSPDMRVFVTEEIRDVTAQITAGLSEDMAPLDRYNAIQNAIKEQVKGCESDGYRCDVYTFHGGYSYQLIKQMEIKDVRLVYAPPESIGKFGGDIDNWMWPRHTGDFSYLRAYVSKDGKSAPYSKDNVPYQPKHVIKLNPQGLEQGDYVMVVGYPGRTNRYRLADEVQAAIDWQYPTQIGLYQQSLATIAEGAKANPEVGVKYASLVAGLNNYLKNFGGQLEGLRRADAVAVKQKQEADLDAWLASRKDANSQALVRDIALLKQTLKNDQATRERDLDLSQLQRSSLFSTGLRLTKLARERGKPDMEREIGYQQRDEIRIKGALEQLDRRYDAGVDQQFLVHALQRYVTLPQDQRLKALDAWLNGADDEAALKARVASLYAGSKLGNTADRMGYFNADAAALASSNDSMLKLASALLPELQKIDDEQKAEAGVLAKLRPRFMEAMIAWKDSQHLPVYPDANSSLRVTYGNVQGVSPRDGVSYAPFTTAEGVVEKATGEVPFNASAGQIAAIKAKDYGPYVSKKQGTLPVDFLADLDITGGNSGSPALDAQGRLVGLAFDGNWESVSGDWLFNPKLNRSIQVDVRYMLWVMDHLDHADNLLKEMGVKQ